MVILIKEETVADNNLLEIINNTNLGNNNKIIKEVEAVDITKAVIKTRIKDTQVRIKVATTNVKTRIKIIVAKVSPTSDKTLAAIRITVIEEGVPVYKADGHNVALIHTREEEMITIINSVAIQTTAVGDVVNT